MIKKLVLIICVLISLSPTVFSREIKVDEMYYLTGCWTGVKGWVVSEVNIWDGPAFTKDGTKVINTLRSTSSENECRGVAVVVIEVADNEFVKIESVVGTVEGWVPKDFLGDKIELRK